MPESIEKILNGLEILSTYDANAKICSDGCDGIVVFISPASVWIEDEHSLRENNFFSHYHTDPDLNYFIYCDGSEEPC